MRSWSLPAPVRDEQLPGARTGQLVSAWDVLEGHPPANDLAVVVLGGWQMGCETAEFLAERGNRVTLISRSPAEALAGDVVESYRTPLLARLRKLGVTLRTLCDVRKLMDGNAIVVAADGSEEVIRANLVVLARGSLPQPTWLDQLRAKVPEVYVIGDCIEPRMIAEALYEGALAGGRI